MYVGESERAVREVFEKARGASPSVIFFDEIESIGVSRGHSPQGGVHVLTTLLNELDGIEERRGVFVLAATNHPQILDPALLRPGRLDDTLYVGLPDSETRSKIIAIKTRATDVGSDFNATAFAHETEGYSGAELVSICHQAGEVALEEQLKTGQLQVVAMRHFQTALGRVTKGVSQEMIKGYQAWGKRERA
ncbi:MAG: hypothetical protein Q9166_004414 [cf. Caloplaca sp. 2 TL-2023]